ncbi:MAG: hypothetical protein ACOVQI_13690, partial [Tagaea sp.]
RLGGLTLAELVERAKKAGVEAEG